MGSSSCSSRNRREQEQGVAVDGRREGQCGLMGRIGRPIYPTCCCYVFSPHMTVCPREISPFGKVFSCAHRQKPPHSTNPARS